MSDDAAWLLLGCLAIAGGIGAVAYLRITREAHDAAYSEPEGGFTRRSELPLTLCPPYDRFTELFLGSARLGR